MAKLSITRALALVNKYTNQLEDIEKTLKPAAVFTNEVAIDGETAISFLDRTSKDLTKLKDLTDKIINIKSSIASVNTVNRLIVTLKPVFPGEKDERSIEATVINLINTKAAYIRLKAFYKNELDLRFTDVTETYNLTVNELDKQIEKNTTALLSSNKQISKTAVAELVEQFKENNKITLKSPFTSQSNLRTFINNITDNIAEIDLALSEFNSKTEVEIDGL